MIVRQHMWQASGDGTYWNVLECVSMCADVCYNVLRMVQANGNVFVLQV